MMNETIKLGNLKIDLGDLTEFILKAKKRCYAGNGKEERLSDGSKRLIFQERDFFYEDNYRGHYQAPGTELVRWQKSDGQGLWQMSYSGGMLPEFIGDEKLAIVTFEFLKKALSDKDAFLRGPMQFRNDSLSYTNELKGDIKRFKGSEEIIDRDNLDIIFSQDYIGEVIIPK